MAIVNEPDHVPDASAEADKSWLRTPLTDPVEIANRYDEWVPTYEQQLVGDWNYTAPVEAARLLLERGAVSPVLDVGCGIGLTGRSLRDAGFVDIDGIDLSPASLATAKTSGAYRTLLRHDFNDAPLPFASKTYASAECVGVLSYATVPANLIRELSRVVVANGTVVFTHRTDLWDEQDFETLLLAMQADRTIRDVVWSDPKPYMPGNVDFADRVLVRYVTATIA